MPSVNLNNSKQQTQQPTSKCPHVILIGNLLKQDLDKKQSEFEYTQQQLVLNPNLFQTENINSIETNNEKSLCLIENNLVEKETLLKCSDCNCYKSLWVCLREDCMYVGCGQDQASNKHSSLHAIVCFRFKLF